MSSGPPLTPEGTVRALRKHSRGLARAWGLLQSKVDGLGCTPAQCHALIEIGLQGELTAQEAAALLEVDKSTASRALRALDREGLVETRVDPDDQRARPVRLSRKGARRLELLHERTDASIERALSHLDEAQRATVIEGVQLYAWALRRSRALEGIEVRGLRRRDQESMARSIRAGLAEYGAVGPGYASEDPELDDLFRAYAGPGRSYLVAERDGTLLAGGGIAPLSGDSSGEVCELQRMFALPAARGLGLGRLLLERNLEAARAAGYRRCYLETLEHMHRARALYEKLGFQPLEAPLGRTGHSGCNRWYALAL